MVLMNMLHYCLFFKVNKGVYCCFLPAYELIHSFYAVFRWYNYVVIDLSNSIIIKGDVFSI